MREELVDNLSFDLDRTTLLQDRIIGIEDYESIRDLGSNSEKVERLISILISKDKDSYEKFLRFLGAHYEWLAAQIYSQCVNQSDMDSFAAQLAKAGSRPAAAPSASAGVRQQLQKLPNNNSSVASNRWSEIGQQDATKQPREASRHNDTGRLLSSDRSNLSITPGGDAVSPAEQRSVHEPEKVAEEPYYSSDRYPEDTALADVHQNRVGETGFSSTILNKEILSASAFKRLDSAYNSPSLSRLHPAAERRSHEAVPRRPVSSQSPGTVTPLTNQPPGSAGLWPSPSGSSDASCAGPIRTTSTSSSSSSLHAPCGSWRASSPSLGFNSPYHSSDLSAVSHHSEEPAAHVEDVSPSSAPADFSCHRRGRLDNEDISEEVIQFVSENPRIMRRWQNLAHQAGLSARVPVIQARIRADGRDFDEHIAEFIREWVERRPGEASLGGLVRLLRSCQFNDTAARLEDGGYRKRLRTS